MCPCVCNTKTKQLSDCCEEHQGGEYFLKSNGLRGSLEHQSTCPHTPTLCLFNSTWQFIPLPPSISHLSSCICLICLYFFPFYSNFLYNYFLHCIYCILTLSRCRSLYMWQIQPFSLESGSNKQNLLRRARTTRHQKEHVIYVHFIYNNKKTMEGMTLVTWTTVMQK